MKPRNSSKSRPNSEPRGRIDWGTAKDVERFDRERSVAVAKAAQAYARLSNRSLSSAISARTRITPWLVIRSFSTDLGSRPIPSAQPFWESPDIWVDSEDPSGNPVVGKPNFVHARILNLGAFDAVPVRIDFFWGDPSVGLNAAHMHLIGTEYMDVRSLRSVDVRCSTPWIPVFENQGHECLMVNCSNWIGDPIINPFQPVLDRHVGQRNLTVIPAAAGMLVSTTIRLGNLFAADVTVDLQADLSQLVVEEQALKSASASDLISKILAFDGRGKKSGAISSVTRKYDTAFLEAHMTEHSRFYNLTQMPAADAEGTDAKGTALSRGLPAMTILRSQLRAGQQRALDFRIGVPESAKVGEFIVCRLCQTVRNQAVGGYTIIIQIIQK